MNEQPYRESPKPPEYYLRQFEVGAHDSNDTLNKLVREGFEPVMMCSTGTYGVTILLVRR